MLTRRDPRRKCFCVSPGKWDEYLERQYGQMEVDLGLGQKGEIKACGTFHDVIQSLESFLTKQKSRNKVTRRLTHPVRVDMLDFRCKPGVDSFNPLKVVED